MNKKQFLERLNFPNEWLSLDLYPDNLFQIQLDEYELEHVDSSEHTRNGAFTWWLHQEISVDVLKKLAVISLVEPDAPLRDDLQKRIRNAKGFNEEVELILKGESGR